MRTRVPARMLNWLPMWAVLAVSSTGATAGVTVADVDAAIGQGVAALLEAIQVIDEIRYRATGKNGAVVQIRGTVTRQTSKWIEIKGQDGKVVRVPREAIDEWNFSGFVSPEMSAYHHGGPTALAGLALLSAGVGHNEPKMAALIESMASAPISEAGTYVRSLRAAVLSALMDRNLSQNTRDKYMRLLKKEVGWIAGAARGNGGYGYTHEDMPHWDHSNTQFANLGLWSGALADVGSSRSTWVQMENHWISTQTVSGGWAYQDQNDQPTPSMTVAGCNSLYIVLDRYYPLREGRYSLYEGVRPNKKAREQMKRVYDAILRGDSFLTTNPPDISQFDGYELFGLERLGLASGRARIGGVDWYAHHVGHVASRRWGGSVVADAFALIFLAHGQAPIFIQKLQYAGDEDRWNYYFRDLAGATRYLSRTFERLYRWQIVPPSATLRDMQDAPILYVSGSDKLELPRDTLNQIRDYIDDGGFVFLHADRAKQPFVRTARKLFEKMFEDRGYRFEVLPKDHPIFRCYFGTSADAWKHRVPLQGLSDGSRVCVFLCPVDIAGAWHQEDSKFTDFFRLFANLRVYAAPPYQQLPRRIAGEPDARRAAPSRGQISVATFKHKGPWDRHPNAWRRYGRESGDRCGIVIEDRGAVDATQLKDNPNFAAVIHVKAPTASAPTEAEVSALNAAMKAGAFVLIDAPDGRSDGIGAVIQWVNALNIGRRDILSKGHPIATGKFDGGRTLLDLQTTDAGASLRQGDAPPPIYLRSIDDRVVLVACPFDLSAGMDRHYIWDRIGYLGDSTHRIVDNILLWHLEKK